MLFLTQGARSENLQLITDADTFFCVIFSFNHEPPTFATQISQFPNFQNFQNSPMSSFASQVSARINISTKQVESVLQLFAEGATVPFVARYRKDMTGGLDEVQILQVQDESKFLKEFTERKASIERVDHGAGEDDRGPAVRDQQSCHPCGTGRYLPAL
jgi:hypothetical protein